MSLRIFATASGSTVPSVLTRMPRSAPMASAVRMVSAACAGPIETAMISVALPASFSRIASSTAISSKGFIDILTLASSTPEPSDLTLIFTSCIDHPFHGHEYLHGFKFGPGFSFAAPRPLREASPCCGAGTYACACLRSTPPTGPPAAARPVRGPGLPGDHLSGRENGSELERPPSTAKAWPLT